MHANTRHGLSNHRIYHIWSSMIARCTKPTKDGFYRYGKRGINICDSWKKFDVFYKDMGLPPSEKHQIDRIDNNKGYFKENCRWVTREENARNTCKSKIWVIEGTEYLSASSAAKALGIGQETIRRWCIGFKCFQANKKWYFYGPKKGCYAKKKYD